PDNQPPSVTVGPDQTIVLPATAALTGQVSDDGRPIGGALTVRWSKVAGPGPVSFDDPDQANTQATFGLPGTYVLRLTATDSQRSANAQTTVVVTRGTVNQPPVVTAGPVAATTLPAPVALTGSVSDDGLPAGGPLTVNWQKVSGPANVTF